MKCFVAFWERLMENQRRRVAIRPALQPTGARITALERQSETANRFFECSWELFSNPTGTRTGSWFSPFLDSILCWKLVSHFMFGTKGSSHPLFPIPHVLTCGKREAVVMKNSCKFFHFKSLWRHCNHTDSWKQNVKTRTLFELVGSALLEDDGLCFRFRGTRQRWTVVCVRNTSPGRLASRIGNRETNTCSKPRFHFF